MRCGRGITRRFAILLLRQNARWHCAIRSRQNTRPTAAVVDSITGNTVEPSQRVFHRCQDLTTDCASALNSVELSSLATLLYVDSSASVLWQATQSQTSAFASAARPRCATLSVRRVGGRVKPVMPLASHVKGTPLPVLYRERKCAKNYNEWFFLKLQSAFW